MSFQYHGTSLEYFDHIYNSTRQNERTVELAVAQHWLPDGDGLEVGNVLGHYDITGHRVVDRDERAPGVENLDVFDITGTFDWIVSISTLEHVGWDTPDQDPLLAIEALQHLRSLLRPNGQMLVTVPGGYHPPLDRFLAHDVVARRAATFIRWGKGWRQTKTPTFKPYGASTPWAESVWIGEW